MLVDSSTFPTLTSYSNFNISPFFSIYISIALMILFREIKYTYTRVPFNVTRFAILSVEFLINSLLSLPDST